MLKRCVSILLSGLFLVSFSAGVEARTNIDVNVGITSAPPAPPATVVMPPQGYSRCYMTRGVWAGSVWVPPHQECSYAGQSGPAVWASGYWGCTVYRGGRCGHWKWYSHRWARGHYRGGYDHGYNHHYDHGHHHRNW